jgi:WD40 repeat protein
LKPETGNMFPKLNTHHSKLKTAFLFFLFAFPFLLLPSLSFAQTVTIPQQYYTIGDIRWADYSPDDKYILTGGPAGAFLWDVETGEVVRMFLNGAAERATFSPDGTRILTAFLSYPTYATRLWSTADGALIRTSSTGGAPVAFGPDGTKFLARTQEGMALWDVTKWTRIRTFADTSGIEDVAFSPDGTKAATGNFDSAVKLWNVSDGTVAHTLQGHTDEVDCVAFSPDGTKLLTTSADQTAKIWNISNGTLAASFSPELYGCFGRAVFSPDGTKILASACYYYPYNYNEAVLMNAADRVTLMRFRGHEDFICFVAFSSDGAKVLTASYDNTARLWNASDGSLIRVFERHSKCVNSVAFSPDGSNVVVGTGVQWDAYETARVTLRKTADGRLLRTFPGPLWNVTSVAFSPDGSKVAAGIETGNAMVWNVLDGTTVTAISGLAGPTVPVAFSPDAKKIVTGGCQNTLVKIWSVSNGALVRTFSSAPMEALSVAFSPDGARVLAGGGGAGFSAILWSVTDGTTVSKFQHAGWVNSVAFSPDGSTVLAGGGESAYNGPGWAQLWRSQDGAVLRTFPVHARPVETVAFSQDGEMVLTGGAGSTGLGEVRIWRVSDGAPVRAVKSNGILVSSAAFSLDGTKVLTGSGDGTARLWEIWRAKAVVVAGGISVNLKR